MPDRDGDLADPDRIHTSEMSRHIGSQWKAALDAKES